MSADFQNAAKGFEDFKTLFNQPHVPLDKCKDLMGKLKLALTKFTSATPSNPDQAKAQLILAREILEHGALLSIKLKDIPSFERYIAQIKPYYYDFGQKLPQSQRQFMILGLNILHLLAKNKLDEFHTELELIPLHFHQDVYIKHPVQLEQYMMEGAYNKVLKAKDSVPHESYSFFMEMLMGTVRDEIADCIAKSYNHLNFLEAQKLLGFSNIDQVKAYATKREWVTSRGPHGEMFVFTKKDGDKSDVPTMKIIQQQLQYARELERII